MTTPTNRYALRTATGEFDPDNLTMSLHAGSVPADSAIVDYNTDADLTNEVSTGAVASYARQALGTATVTEDDTANEAQLDYADVEFGTLETGATPTYCAVIDLTSDEVMWVAEIPSPQATNGDTYTTVVPTDGLAAHIPTST